MAALLEAAIEASMQSRCDSPSYCESVTFKIEVQKSDDVRKGVGGERWLYHYEKVRVDVAYIVFYSALMLIGCVSVTSCNICKNRFTAEEIPASC